MSGGRTTEKGNFVETQLCARRSTQCAGPDQRDHDNPDKTSHHGASEKIAGDRAPAPFPKLHPIPKWNFPGISLVLLAPRLKSWNEKYSHIVPDALEKGKAEKVPCEEGAEQFSHLLDNCRNCS